MNLQRELRFMDVFCIGAGAMTAGLFILPGTAYELCGSESIAAFFIAALLAIGGILQQGLFCAVALVPGVYTVCGIKTSLDIKKKVLILTLSFRAVTML